MTGQEIGGFIVLTAFVNPPIPVRMFDWIAWFDKYGEDGPSAHGRTEQAAIERLMRSQGMTADGKCVDCHRKPSDVLGCSVGGCPIGEDA